jgi:hypothetical protein
MGRVTADSINYAHVRELLELGLISQYTADSALSEIQPGWEFGAGIMNGQRWQAREMCAEILNARAEAP